MATVGAAPENFLVGDFAWLSDRQVFWFIAHGDTEADGRVIEFDEVQVLHRDRVAFVRERKVIAYLVSIDHADVEDPDDYRVAWGIWQQVAPARTALVSKSRSRQSPSL